MGSTRSKAAKAKTGPHKESGYQILFREPGGKTMTASVPGDAKLYPLTASWNRVLSADMVRSKQAGANWGATGRGAFLALAREGIIAEKEIDPFISACAKSGLVQIEFSWSVEDVGWAGRLFPWEQVLALATKEERKANKGSGLLVVRYLSCPDLPKTDIKHGPPGFAPCNPTSEEGGMDFEAERVAIATGLGEELTILRTDSLKELEEHIRQVRPRILHLATNDWGEGPLLPSYPGGEPLAQDFERVAQATVRHCPELAVYSVPFSGRRLAPIAVANGARYAVGFHGDVYESSIPLFFGAFYREWARSGSDLLAAAKAGLLAHNTQLDSSDLGIVTLWTSKPLLTRTARTKAVPTTEARKPSEETIPKEKIAAALSFLIEPEKALNYSVLHNTRGGLFSAFAVTKNMEGTLPKLEVLVRLDTGDGRVPECRFDVEFSASAGEFQDLSKRVVLPLGAPLLRQRGEAFQATVETEVKCDGTDLRHDTSSITLLPCDEWRDDETGRHLLPSFIFPRDPAVREILTAAQPFLRALSDRPQAGFDGYQGAFGLDPVQAVTTQVRAIWAALQHPLRLDYVNPPPAYMPRSQRLRTPEEILRARRGTCIELALLLASCLEHIGIFPVIFLTAGHAFLGYWTGEEARERFAADPEQLVENAGSGVGETPDFGSAALHEGTGPRRKFTWMFAEPHHLWAIRGAVESRALIPVEATGVALQRPFEESVEDATGLLASIRDPLHEFDGMLDVQTARAAKVTPLPILSQGPAA